ncbi:hypothetical protein CJ030_MR6G022428 [Morella rubra]|uniref:Sieve element occlusion N-terminal domain-containing protein n=1 Tax=Morella rubra TaxID=262757 RepID=A0A6A1VFR6_9ROSI|nr:hypothetical protein CJ030_MR6G022428 [Morella rubra]
MLRLLNPAGQEMRYRVHISNQASWVLYQQPSQLGSLQQQSQLGSLQQPSQLGSLQQPSQLGSLQQPTQLSSLQQPTQLSSLQQPTQMGSLVQQPTQMGSLQQPSRPSALQGSFQQPSQLVSLQQPAQLGSLQQYSQMGALQQPSHLGSLQPQYGLARPLAPVSMQQLIKGDRGMLTLSDDNVMVNQILATHAPDGREVHARSLLHLVEDILNRASLRPDALITTGTPGLVESFEDKTHQAGFLAMLDVVLHTIDRISCELACKTLGGTDAHQVTLDIFHTVSYYAWDAKLVLTLAAFSLHYGEFWLLAQIHTTNQLAKAMALLRQVPGVLEQAGLLKPRLDALSDLIKAVLEVTRCVVGFTELPSLYITPDVPALSSAMAHIPTAVYWTIRSIVVCTVCATQITSFTSQGYEYVFPSIASFICTLIAQ